MRTNNVIILVVVAVVLVGLAVFGIGGMTPTNDTDNNTTNNTTLNLSDNTTNNMTENQTASQQTKKKTNSNTKKQSNDGVTYDAELNEYFDNNGKTVKEGQFPKGTSKQDVKRGLQEIGDT